VTGLLLGDKEGEIVGPVARNMVEASNISVSSKRSLWGHTFARLSLPAH